MKQYTKITSLILGSAAIASAQTGGLTVEVSNIITPQNPTATINVYANIINPVPSYGIAGAIFDLYAEESGFGDITFIFQEWSGGPILPMNHGDWLEDVQTGQTFPSGAPVSMPQLLLSVEWTTQSFGQRDLSIWSDVSLLWTHEASFITPIPNPTNGYATIQIIPAPTTSFAFLAAAGAVGLRRRR